MAPLVRDHMDAYVIDRSTCIYIEMKKKKKSSVSSRLSKINVIPAGVLQIIDQADGPRIY